MKFKSDLGPLEWKVMKIVWNNQAVTVQDVLERLSGGGLAYTTVMTVMVRLREKGWLRRQKDGRRYVYLSLKSREELAEQVARSLVIKFSRHFGREKLTVLRREIGRYEKSKK